MAFHIQKLLVDRIDLKSVEDDRISERSALIGGDHIRLYNTGNVQRLIALVAV